MQASGVMHQKHTQHDGWCACMLSSGGKQLQSQTISRHHSCQHTNMLASFQQLATPGSLSRYRPVPGAHLALCMAPGENTPAGLCVLPTQLCSSLPPSSGSRGSPHLNRKYCSTRGATLSTRLIRSPSSKGTAKPAQQEQQQRTCHKAMSAAATCWASWFCKWLPHAPLRTQHACCRRVTFTVVTPRMLSSHAAPAQVSFHLSCPPHLTPPSPACGG